ncbi:MAG: hypothetical protein FWJ70_07015 [Micromonosporaceae bacterium]
MATRGRLTALEQVYPRGPSSPLHAYHRHDEAWYVPGGDVLLRVRGVAMHAATGSFVWAPSGAPAQFPGRVADGADAGDPDPGGFDELSTTGSPARRRTPVAAVVPPDLGPLVDEAHRRGCDLIGPPMAAPAGESG